MHKRLPCRLITAGLFLVGSLAVSRTEAQNVPLDGDTLTFEPIGDRPFSSVDDLAFGSGGTLYAAMSEIFRLLPGEAEWEQVSYRPEDPPAEYVIAFGLDTLVSSTWNGYVNRSVDSGETWIQVSDEGGVLYETSIDGPHEGLLLSGVNADDSTGNPTGAAYSVDWGGTWTLATFNIPAEAPIVAWDFAAFPEGHPFEDRLIFGGVGGLAYSDDHGQTWTPSNIWETFVSSSVSLAVGADGMAYAIAGHQGFGGVYASEDGATWEERSSEPGNGYLVSVPGTAEHPDGGLLYAMQFPPGEWEEEEPIEVWLSTDGGWMWEVIGRIPEPPRMPNGNGLLIVEAAPLLGPDGRLYVALSRTGPATAWVYRTTEPVVVPIADEAGPEPPEGLALTAHPNPSSGVVEVRLELAEPADARVAVFDLRGREVALLQNGPLPAGAHVFTWESAGVAAGVYVIRAEAGEARVSRRVTVAR